MFERLRIKQAPDFSTPLRGAANDFGDIFGFGRSDCPGRLVRAKEKKKSSPALRPLFSSIGRTSSSVVPGYVVDSRMISIPGWKYFTISSQADTM